jgi:hypothetical protein
VAQDRFAACAEQLAGTPELIMQILDDHSPTADGWCRVHEAHPERHPCSIRALAELAQAMARPAGRAR